MRWKPSSLNHGGAHGSWWEVWVTNDYDSAIDVVMWEKDSPYFVHAEPLTRKKPLAGPFPTLDVAQVAATLIASNGGA